MRGKAWLALALAVSVSFAGPSRGAYNPRWTPEEHQLARSFGIKEFDLRAMTSVPDMPECQDPQKSDFFARFRTFEEIEDFLLNKLCRLRDVIGARGSSCLVREVGRSVEGRPIYAVELRNPSAIAEARAAGKPERSILVTGTVHAREWTTTSSVLYSAAHLDVNDVSILLIPVVNPDGYVYTWSGKKNIKKMWTKDGVKGWQTEARLWRKNRQRNRDGTLGVDLNRNFGTPGKKIWGTDRMNKSLNITESDVFQGKHGFSEPETATIKNYFLENKDTVVAFYDVHCCIGALLEPFSRAGKAPAYVHDTGKVMLQAINTQTPATGRYAWRARPQSSASGTGISSSWAYQEAGITFTYVVEIRGKFVSSCTEIKPIGLETMYGLAALAGEMSRLDEILKEYSAGRPLRRTPPSVDTAALERFALPEPSASETHEMAVPLIPSEGDDFAVGHSQQMSETNAPMEEVSGESTAESGQWKVEAPAWISSPGTGQPMAIVLRGNTIFEVQEVSPMRPTSWMVDQSVTSDGSLLVCTPLDLSFLLLPLLLQARDLYLDVHQILARGDLPGYKALAEETALMPEIHAALARISETEAPGTGQDDATYKLSNHKCRSWLHAKAERAREVLCAQEIAKMQQGAVTAHIADAKGATAVEGFQFGTKRNAGSARDNDEAVGSTVKASTTISSKKRAQFLRDVLALLSDYIPAEIYPTLRSDLELEASVELDEVDVKRHENNEGRANKENGPQQAGEEEAERMASEEAQESATKAKPKPKPAEAVVPVAIRRLERVDKRGMAKLSTFFGVKKPKVSADSKSK
ncbi:Carboxypeptidase B [Hondaea fermentalgiana]|uniref:Carboxypeptidase B n=1 Tax=Hondaea fermentalgiana TaxID=2315210 RepID=A0A2R5GES9_9STRA|nr:Carboxypeptidase B [Hondaea fermentalgiana]|eukprot:GBG29075.1 Carboxypeptidase B [Hondaea fermentalgiana]